MGVVTEPRLKTLCVDFDGVIHDYAGGWKGPNLVAGGPVPGACQWLAEMVMHYRVCIYSSRSSQPGGRSLMAEAIRRWMERSPELPEKEREHIARRTCEVLEYPTEKPPAYLTIDDRAFLFEGTFPSLEYIRTFKPWNRRA